MSITDELRRLIEDPLLGYASRDLHIATLTKIADSIDAEHEKAMSRAGQFLADAEKDRDYNYANWQECKQKVLQGNITFDELNARIECLEDKLSHCIEPLKDAGGEYIFEHDKVDWRDHTGTWHENATVVALCNDGCYVMDGTMFHVHKSDIRHHPDTWERIIDDAEALAREWFNTDMSENEHAEGLDALVARCKVLAGDE